MRNPNEAPRFSDKLSRRAFNAKFTAPFLAAAVALVSVVTSCDRTDSDVPPGKKALDEGSEALAKKAREAAGMGSPTAAPLQAKEKSERPTIAGPDLQATVYVQQTKIAELSPAKTPESAKPAEKPKREGDFEIALKPQDLYRALLTTPFNPEDLPKGFEPKGNQAGNLDATIAAPMMFIYGGSDDINFIFGKDAKAFNAIGQANILIIDKNLEAPRGLESLMKDKPNSVISFTIFPNPQGAKDLYDIFQTKSSQASRPIQDLGYPASVKTMRNIILPELSILTAPIQNIFLAAATYVSKDNRREQEAILLAKAGLKHLQKVGNPGR